MLAWAARTASRLGKLARNCPTQRAPIGDYLINFNK